MTKNWNMYGELTMKVRNRNKRHHDWGHQGQKRCREEQHQDQSASKLVPIRKDLRLQFLSVQTMKVHLPK